MQDVTNPVSLPYFYCLYDIPLLFVSMEYFILSHIIGVTDFLLSSPGTTSQTFPGISDLILEVCTSQPHKKLCSKSSTPLLSSLDLSPI